MTFDTFTIILGSILLAYGFISAFFSPLTRKPKRHSQEEPAETGNASISIVLAVHDEEQEIERNLPILLNQEYDGQYEVIVVDESSTDDTSEVLKRLKNKYPNIYTTFIPSSSHYISRRKLSLTVGVKAAKYDWILFTNANCRPSDSHWLKAMASHCTEANDLVLGLTRYSNGATDYERYDRIATWFRQVHEASRRKVYAYCGHNMLLRKDLFLKKNGFLANLKFLRGEYDFLANEYGDKYRTAIADSPAVIMTEEPPTKKSWVNDHIYHIETRKHLANGFVYSLLEHLDNFMLHSNLAVQAVAVAVSLTINNYIITIAAILGLIMSYLIRVFIANRVMTETDEDISPWKIPFLETIMAWRNLQLNIKHNRCDKYDFIRR